jgi:hypothetical protein
MTRITQRPSLPVAAAPAGSLRELSDPSTVTSIEGLATRLSELNAVFNKTDDRRGVFTAVYAPCVQALVKDIRGGQFRDGATAERVVLALGKSYLEGLQRDGRGAPGGPGSSWDSFSRLVKDPKVSDARLLASSINAHWSADLPGALVAGRAPAGFEGDFQQIGRVLVAQVAKDLERPQGPNGRRVAGVFRDQAALAGLSKVFGLQQVMSTGMKVLLAEAFASSRLPAALKGANHLKWSAREGLIGAL